MEEQQVECYDRDGDAFQFNSQAEASRALNICQSSINKALAGERQHAGGYFWRYIKK